jgi:hypothetical protein
MKQTAVEWLDYLEKYWKYYDTSCTKQWVKKDGGMILILELSTCGISDNEIIINELKKSLFWDMHWFKSLKGGHYTFEIDFRVYGYMSVPNYVKLTKTTKQKIYHNPHLYDWIHISAHKKMIKEK